MFLILLGEEFLPGCVDIRADGILGHLADSGSLADGVALGFPDDDPIDRLVDRAVAGEQLGTSLEKILLWPRERDVFELVYVLIVCSEQSGGAIALQVGSDMRRQRRRRYVREGVRWNVVQRGDADKALWVREHSCPACGFTADRDENASYNVQKLGLDELGIGYDVDAVVGLGEAASTPVETAFPPGASERDDSSFRVVPGKRVVETGSHGSPDPW